MMRYLMLSLIGVTFYLGCGFVAALLCLALPRKFFSKIAILNTEDLKAVFYLAPLSLLLVLVMWAVVLVYYPSKLFTDWVLHASQNKLEENE